MRETKPSPKKPRPFAAAEVYAHLKPVPDILEERMRVMFCGINPGMRSRRCHQAGIERAGKMSSAKGHHFAHPTNKFWVGAQLFTSETDGRSAWRR
jgi:TDG/mug DNA glycosylase family protein